MEGFYPMVLYIREGNRRGERGRTGARRGGPLRACSMPELDFEVP